MYDHKKCTCATDNIVNIIIVGPVSVSVGLSTADDDSALAAVSTGPIDTAPVAAPWSPNTTT